jgi:FkbM family methyltransferase
MANSDGWFGIKYPFFDLGIDFMKSIFNELKRRFNSLYSKDYLNSIKGIIHVGANEGQEKDLYAFHQLKVLWVEPIPDTFDKLIENIRPYINQHACRALLSDKDGQEVVFNIANNGGASSSMLDLGRHRDLWPKVEYTSQINLTTITLETLLNENNISINDYQALSIDTQGTELLVLSGGKRILRKIKYVKVEVADFEAYTNCCTE